MRNWWWNVCLGCDTIIDTRRVRISVTASKVECILGLCHDYCHAPGLSQRMRREKGRPTASKQLFRIFTCIFFNFRS